MQSQKHWSWAKPELSHLAFVRFNSVLFKMDTRTPPSQQSSKDSMKGGAWNEEEAMAGDQ